LISGVTTIIWRGSHVCDQNEKWREAVMALLFLKGHFFGFWSLLFYGGSDANVYNIGGSNGIGG
jgi:hypothetical protein